MSESVDALEQTRGRSDNLEDRLRRAERDRDALRASLEEVRRAERLFRSVVNDQTDFVVRWLPDFTRTFVNDAYCREFGQPASELIGTSFLPLVHDEHRDAVEAKIASITPDRPVASGRHRVLKPDGVVTWHHWVDRGIFDEQGELVELQSVGRDITDQVEIEGQLREAQKTEALGRLAAGLAHDFNNFLTVILAAATLMRERVDDGSDLGELSDEITDAAELAGDLTRQLLAFSRHQLLELRVSDLNAIVAEYEPMLRRIVRDDIDVRIETDVETGNVRADRTQLGQVLINLVNNAVDAMPGGGTLVVSTALRAGANDTVHASITVADTGCGIAPELHDRVFDPFFTTKEFGGGNGLGLSSVRGIIAQHGGHVSVDSAVGSGTRVEVTFPVVEEAPDEPSVGVPGGELASGDATILVLDDNEAVLDVVVRTLRLDGRRVFRATSSDEAERVARRESIDVLVTDVVLRGPSGPTVYESLRRESPGMKVIYMSGYADKIVELRGGLEATFLPKPFGPNDLRACVADVLGRGAV